MRSQGPPSSFPSGLQPVANDPSGRHLVRRISRTDLDFEQALRGDGTVMLKEGIDMSALGVESPGPANRSYSSSSHSTPSGTPVNRSISRVPLQPSTPVVVPASPSPPGPSNLNSLSMSSPNVPTRHATAPMVSSQLSASLGPTPASSSHDLVTDAEEAERQTNRRSMYRSSGTSSSPDLATLLRKAKERGGPVPPGATNGSGLGRKDKRRDDPPPLPDQTVRGQIPNFGSAGDSGRDWASLSPRQNRDATIKAPKSSVRAKTSAFLGKMLGQNTVRERSKTDASLHPSSASQPPPALMNVFAPPVPPIPSEHRSPRHSPNIEGPSPTTRFADSGKPLPPIFHSPSTMREGEDYDDRSIVFVDKVTPLPPLPSSPPVTPVRAPAAPSRTTSANGPKRRSMSVSDAEVRLVLPPVPSPVPSPAAAIPSPAPVPRTPSNRRHESTDHTLHGILDLFKGELSTLDPISGASLDLLDPSSPSRRINHRSKTDGHILSTWEDPQDEREDQKSTPTLNDPFGGRPNLTSEDPPTFTPTIVPPRTSSLASPRNSIGSGPISPSRPLSTPRSRSGPPTSAIAAQNLSPRAASGLRSLHRSTASSSEPSLIPLPGDGRTFPPSRRGSQQELRSPDSLQFVTSPTIIGGEEGADLEPRAQDLATKCWNDNDEFLPKEKIAEWLGGHGPLNRIALRYYIDNFDFTGLRLDMAFRRLCGKLFLKAETQQVDRILEQFSRRYWECNLESVFGSANLVHAVSYSLLLLNTDLHVAELAAHMSKNQFVRNTMTAIQMQIQPDSLTRTTLHDGVKDDSSSVREGSDETEVQHRSKRSDSVTSWSSLGRETGAHFAAASAPNGSSLGVNHPNGSNPSVQSAGASAQDLQNRQFGRAWETDMESLLKEMYNAVKSQQILQPLNSLARSSTSSLSPGGSAMLRNRSLRSQPDRLTTLKRGSIRGLQSILTVQSGISPYSSNSSIDGRVSPSPSFATSTHELYGSSSTFLNPTLGFASNLSHTIIREAQEDDDRSIRSEATDSTTISISDEELALLGAPWAKEGMLCRKQYWESAGKRAKDKNWMDVFVVIQKGELNMFTFGDHTSGGTGTFGGGNWLANAESVGTIQLAHALAHALPPPGYHKRPHCMVLTLASRGVYFFQAGTEELVNEWVSTCNYWAARTSKEPLAGGVSNMEYGWNRVADLYGHGRSQSQTDLRKDDVMDTMSVRSGKSTRSKYGWKDGSATVRGGFSPRGDKTFINDWKPPMHPTVASIHDEEAQLDALRKHVESLKKDLETHNELREPMSALYTPRTASAIKAQTNWEEKSQYLLREIVKYDLYIDSLHAGMNLRLKKRGEKALELALNHSDPDNLKKSRKLSGPPESPIVEESEPATPIIRTNSNKNHRRELAESHDDDDDD